MDVPFIDAKRSRVSSVVNVWLLLFIGPQVLVNVYIINVRQWYETDPNSHTDTVETICQSLPNNISTIFL